MSNWKTDAADANLRMASKMLEQQEDLNATRIELEKVKKAAREFLAITDRNTKTANALRALIEDVDTECKHCGGSGCVACDSRILQNMKDKPNLGLATTRELLNEIKARGEVSATIGEYPEEMGAMASGAANLLESLPGSMLEYKTVGGTEYD